MTNLRQRLTERRCLLGDGTAHCSLADLDRLRSATIVGFTSDDAVTRRLTDLGFAPGQSVELQRRAPLRDPLVFAVAGVELALRRSEASRILVSLP